MMYPEEYAAIRAERIKIKNNNFLRNRLPAEQLNAEKQRARLAEAVGRVLQHAGSAIYAAGNNLRTRRGLKAYG